MTYNFMDQFPQAKRNVNGKKLIYLDSAATTLKHKSVVELMGLHDLTGVANVHRGAHYLSDRATFMFEESREKLAQLVNAKSKEEIIFTSGTTGGLNLIANSILQHLSQQKNHSDDDEILITEMEHHSNIVPWQLASRANFKIKAIPVLDNGMLDMAAAKKMISSKTKVLSVVHTSNATGVINPVEELIVLAKKVNALVVVDAAQTIGVMPVDVQSMDCDFLVFSGHKMFGPFGIGVLWGKQGLLDVLPPYQGGGSMIKEVKIEQSTFLPSPHRYEAGTPNITGAIGLSQAVRFINELDRASILEEEMKLVSYVESELLQIPGLKIYGSLKDTDTKKAPIVSFNLAGAHSSDLGHLLNEQGIAVRTGHHCCQPLMQKFGVAGTVRASFSIYNNNQDAEQFVTAVKKATRLLA